MAATPSGWDQVLAVSVDKLNTDLGTLLSNDNDLAVVYGDFKDVGVIDATLKSIQLGWAPDEKSDYAATALLKLKFASGKLFNAEYPPTLKIDKLDEWEFTTHINLESILQRPVVGASDSAEERTRKANWASRLADQRHYDIERLYTDLATADWSKFEPELSSVPSGAGRTTMNIWRSTGNGHLFRLLSFFLDNWCAACRKANLNSFGSAVTISNRPAQQIAARFTPTDLNYRMCRMIDYAQQTSLALLYCETVRGHRGPQEPDAIPTSTWARIFPTKDNLGGYFGRYLAIRREVFIENHLLPALQRLCTAIDVTHRAAEPALPPGGIALWFGMERDGPQNNSTINYTTSTWAFITTVRTGGLPTISYSYRKQVIPNPNPVTVTRGNEVMKAEVTDLMSIEIASPSSAALELNASGSTNVVRRAEYKVGSTTSGSLDTDWTIAWNRKINFGIGFLSTGAYDSCLSSWPDSNSGVTATATTNKQTGISTSDGRNIDWWKSTIENNLNAVWAQIQNVPNNPRDNLLKYLLPASGLCTYKNPYMSKFHDILIDAEVKYPTTSALNVTVSKPRTPATDFDPKLPAIWSMNNKVPGGQSTQISIKFTSDSPSELLIKAVRLFLPAYKRPNTLFFEDNFDILLPQSTSKKPGAANIKVSKSAGPFIGVGNVASPSEENKFRWCATLQPDTSTQFLSLKAGEFLEFTIAARTTVGRLFGIEAVADLKQDSFPAGRDMVGTTFKVSLV